MKKGLSTCSKLINEQLFIDYNRAGITHMEIATPHDNYKNLDYKQIAAFSKKYEITLWSFHLPFSPFREIDISSAELCRHTIEYYTELIKKASDIGINKFIIHPSGEPIAPEDRASRLACAKNSLNTLAEIAATYNCTILCENLPRTCLGRNSDEMLELISVNDKLRIVFDTNHLLNEDYCEFIKKTGKHISSVHISDYDFIDECHWLPGEGKVDWNKLYNALRAEGYDGPWLYEVSFTCPSDISRPRDLNCMDFSRNADEIFASHPLTIISQNRAKEN